LVDHTLLKPEATEDDITALIEEGATLGVYSVCVPPPLVKHAKEKAKGRMKIATVAGFPSGQHASSVKAAEARQAVEDGAQEVDMVINIGHAKAGKFDEVRRDIEIVREAVPDAVLKVIIESAALTDEQIVKASMAAELAGADFVKTSTGFHPAGGATPHAVALMSQTVGDRLGVKASGGVRTLEDAQEMISNGATRLGVSGTAGIIAGFGVVGMGVTEASDGY